MLNLSALPAMKRIVRDNPIVEKDAATMLRTPLTTWIVVGAGLALLALVAFVHAVNEPQLHQLAQWQSFEPSGRAMFVAVCGALLFFTTFLVPALASSAIAGERERGTLPLLLVSSLSADRIVGGKIASLLLGAAPLFALALPMFGLASIYGGVSLGDVALALAASAFHLACVAAAGLGASAVVARARTAAPLAMMFAAVPSFFFGIPGIVAMERFVDGKDVALVLPLLVSGGAVSAAFAAACLLLARDQVAPARAPRWSLRKWVVGFVLVALPVVAVSSLWFLGGAAQDYDKDEIATATVLLTVLVVVVTAVVEVCVSDRCPRAAGEAATSPRKRALVVGALASLGLLLAALVPLPLPRTGEFEHFLDQATLMQGAHVGLVVTALWIVFAACTASVASRIAQKPAVRIALSMVFLFGLFVLPFPLSELRFILGDVLGRGEFPLGFTNPLIVGVELTERFAATASDHPRYREPVSLFASLAFFTLGTLLLFALGKGRRAS